MEKIIIVKWRIKESETSRILKLLPELAEKTRSEEGNISYMIYQSENDPCELILCEHYTDTTAAESHRQSEHYKRIVAEEIIPYLESREVISVKKLV
ncbi:antibiotic biosynthesis monooxygenase [Nostoc sp. MBR 210]|uniref:Antibiotic biosynthesis monooxygenase n=1 Tax=Nostoc spongiaeforme FACHB-130 TaxID=1357510 RepID=A0ABR8FQ66_9NOSO|nr:putative quinol monooxygenase [Nostoc spongiaeforme]MBD2593304.1 antibiotic biosynthesis monooxygenase [Nostoc spongiaeforme FACHB-130]OCQ91222.1 antibiotic biosynthesis monooxygenase [Nostoc sp. MBR 210]